MIAVVGGGVIGLSVAWRAAQAGLPVTVVDPEPVSGGASYAAAGMLCPVTEVHFGETDLLRLNLASLGRWPAFAAELSEVSGTDIGLRRQGTLSVGFNDDDLRVVEELRRYQEELGVSVSRLGRRACRELEPLLSPRVRGGVFVDDEMSVDNRRLCRALLAAAIAAGAHIVRERAVGVIVEEGRAIGVDLAAGHRFLADTVVVAAGAWSPDLAGLPTGALPPVRPVKGQILRLRFDPLDPPITRNIRAIARGWAVYLVPRDDGELVVGATVEEKGFDIAVTAGAVRELLQAAIDVVPAVAELEHVESVARLRPGTPDNGPIMGPTPVEGLLMATGHYRNGILLAPITAEALVALLVGGCLPEASTPFTLERFG